MSDLKFNYKLENEQPPAMTESAFIQKIQEQIQTGFLSARGKSVSELSDETQFCIAALAGVPLCPPDPHESRSRVSCEPCSIVNDGTGFIVTWVDPFSRLCQSVKVDYRD